MNPVDIAYLVAAIVFLLFVIFLAKFLYTASKTLQKTTDTLQEIQRQINDLNHWPRDLISHANEISCDIKKKLNHLDPLFRVVSNLGEKLEITTHIDKKIVICRVCKEKLYNYEEPEESTVMQSVQLALKAVRLWQNLKQGS